MSEKHNTGFCSYCRKQKALIKDSLDNDNEWRCTECGISVSLTGIPWACPKCHTIEILEIGTFGDHSVTCSMCNYGTHRCVQGCSFTTGSFKNFETHIKSCDFWKKSHTFPPGCIITIVIIGIIILMSLIK